MKHTEEQKRFAARISAEFTEDLRGWSIRNVLARPGSYHGDVHLTIVLHHPQFPKLIRYIYPMRDQEGNGPGWIDVYDAVSEGGD